MVKLSATQKLELFNAYAHALFCEESNLEGSSHSLGALARFGGKTPDKLCSGDRRGKVAEILTGLDKSYAQKVLLLEDAARGYYQISRDCDDEGFIKDTMEKLEQVLPLIKADNKQNFETRNKIFNRLYDLDEQLSPRAFDRRFSLLEKMVRDVKQNDGGYDHDPLNTAARRLDYFMKAVSAQKRLALLWQIRKKTVDQTTYDYSRLNERLLHDYAAEKKQKSEDNRLQKLDRYDQIRTEALPSAFKPEEKIGLYTELMTLVDAQDWTRGRKFAEKKTICNHLIDLNTEIGNEEGRKAAFAMRQKYIDAGYKCREAARKKGYYSRG